MKHPPPDGPRDPLKAEYANYFQIGHNQIELVIDFGYGYDEQESLLHTRIITSPLYAKVLLGLLRESIEQYEALYGSIDRH
jgi:hypothetical protein